MRDARASRVLGIAGFVVRFVINDPIELRFPQSPGERLQRQRTVVPEARLAEHPAGPLPGVSNQRVVEVGKPSGVEPETAHLRQLGHRVPPAVILGDQQNRRAKHLQRPTPLAEKLLPEEIGRADSPTVVVEAVVAMDRLGQVHSQPVDVKLLDELGRTANE